MRHPFDGINESSTPAPQASPPQTRRSALGRMLGVAAGLIGVGRLARAQQATTQAVGEEGAVLLTRRLGENGITKALNEAGMTQAKIPSETGILRPAPQSMDLTDKQMEEAWTRLGDADPAKATEASNRLYTAKKVVPFLKEKLKVDAKAIDEKHVGELIQDLDADDFGTREKASLELQKMGPNVTPTIQAAMPKAGSLEVRRRLEMILVKLREGEDILRVQRGLKILIDMPNKEARDVVEGISKQTPETWLTHEAKTALAAPKVPTPVDPKQQIFLPPIQPAPVRIEVLPKK